MNNPFREGTSYRIVTPRPVLRGQARWPGGAPPSASGERVVAVLLALGAVILARQEHGTFVGLDRRLVFVRKTRGLDAGELADISRAARLTPARFEQLLARLAADDEKRHTA